MEDPRALESQETGEGRIDAGEANRELEEATFEPEARVESGESIEQAEAIEAAFVEAVQVTAGEEIAALSLPIPTPALQAAGDEIAVLPVPVPTPAGDEIAVLPIPVPTPAGDEIAVLPVPVPTPAGDEIAATPITLPKEASEMERGEVSATPITLPTPAPVPDGDQISATPISLAGEPEAVVEVVPTREVEQAIAEPLAGSTRAIEGESPVGDEGDRVQAAGFISEPGAEGAAGESGQPETTFSEELGGAGEGPVETMAPGAEQLPEVKEYWEPPEMYVYHGPDGSISFVDAQGNPIASPPFLKGVPDGDAGGSYSAWYYGTDPSEAFEVKEYIPPTSGIYAYTAQDGSIRLVDEKGNDVPCPPWVYGGGKGEGQDQLYTKGPDGKAIEIPLYQPPVEGVYAYTAQDGSIRLVDENGKDVPCPPWVFGGGKGEGQDQLYTKGPDGKAIEIPAYQPPTQGVYAYTAQDGSIRLVDENGKDVPCPPSFVQDPEKGEVFTKGPEGQKIEIPAYQPSLDGVYSHTAPDGFVTLVDKSGALVYSPPSFYKDGTDGTVYGVGPKGEKVEIPPYKPGLGASR